ncbi:MAG: RT0821/Lpp0805 family surface protein [Alphaproteobacteria bacterium]
MSCSQTAPQPTAAKNPAKKSSSATPSALRDQVPERALQRALETLTSGQSFNWQDQTTGGTGSITPTRTFRIGDGSFCRDYTILFSGAGAGSYMLWRETACRNGDGQWHMIDGKPSTAAAA